MKSIFQFIAFEHIKYKLKKKQQKKTNRAGLLKEVNTEAVILRHVLHDSLFMALGILSACFGLTGFLLPNTFIDGGVTGISLILAELSQYPLSFYLVIINIPFMLLAFSTVSRQFAIRSMMAVTLLALSVHLIHFPVITNDKLLVAVFGGFFLGMGIGLAIRGGAVIDGTEVLAVFISKKTSLSIGDVILLFNLIIFLVAAWVFNIETSLYAILTYMAAAKTVDFVVSGIEEYVGVTIISDHSEEIRLTIVEKMGRGCTLYEGKKGYASKGVDLKPTQIVYTLVTKLEIAKLQTEIDKIDQEAFIIMHSVKDARGGMIKKRPLKH